MVILTPIENCQPAFARRSKTLVFQNPESARNSGGLVAPALRTRAISSSQKRSIPRWVFRDFQRMFHPGALPDAETPV